MAMSERGDKQPRKIYRLRRRRYQNNVGQENHAPADHGGLHHAERHGGSHTEVAAAELQTQVEQLRDQLVRKQAEFENFRRRQRRDEQQRAEMANQRLLEELLPVLDNFDRALANPGESVEALLNGIQMVRRQFGDLLRGNGLEPVEAIGLPFDPNLHEAVATDEGGEQPSNTVVEVFQEGYRLKGRLLRPAMVKVAK